MRILQSNYPAEVENKEKAITLKVNQSIAFLSKLLIVHQKEFTFMSLEM